MDMGRVIEVTFLLVLAYLVVANADGFSTAIRAMGNTYTGAVRTLQGR